MVRHSYNVGDKHNKLTLVKRVNGPQWLCKCDCGDVKTYDVGNVRRGNTSQCKACANKSRSIKHTTHGMGGNGMRGNATPEYGVRRGMINRCTNPNDSRYKHYGDRGIKVCSRWLESFENFYADMGPRPDDHPIYGKYKIDRIDNDGGYGPDNCKWNVGPDEWRNRRDVIVLMIDGVTKSLQEWAIDSPLNIATIRRRLHAGVSAKEAVFAPALPGRPVAKLTRG